MDKIRPEHYNKGTMEVINIIKHAVTHIDNKYYVFCVANVLKYCLRFENKGGAEDIKKAIKYLEFVLKDIEDDQV